MGLLASKLKELFSSSEPTSVLMLGLDAAGKTTVLYHLKLGDFISSVPTVGFNVEVVKINKTSFTVWDIGGQTKIRAMWHQFYANTNGLVFVVDSSDRERISEACNELRSILKDPAMLDVPVLVLGNKSDLPEAMDEQELGFRLRLHEIKAKNWSIQMSVATTGEGLVEGFTKLNSMMRKR